MTSGVAFTPEEMEIKKSAIVNSIVSGTDITFSGACMAHAVGVATVYEWRETDVAFDKAIIAARKISRATGIDFAESVLIKKIRKEETVAVLFYLKTQGKDRGYVEKTVHAGDPANPIQHAGQFTLTFGTEDNDGDDEPADKAAAPAEGNAVGPA